MQRSERAAYELLARYDINEPPVPVEQTAEELGVHVEFVTYEDEMSGMLYRDNERGVTVMGINSFHPTVRQRFSIGHELGHFLLHKNRLLFVDKLYRVTSPSARPPTSIAREEVEANSFAAAFLMPERLIDEALEGPIAQNSGLNDREIIEALAERFKVSTQAMEYRLTNLGLLIPS